MASRGPYGTPEQQYSNVSGETHQPGLEFDSSQNPRMHDKQNGTYGRAELEHNGPWPESRSKQVRNPFGLSPLLFGFLVALITAIVVGGAVGGGVGSQIKSCGQLSDSVSTTTVSATKTSTASSAASPTPTTYINYVPALPAQVLSVPLDCPNLNNSPHTTIEGDTFTFVCGVDFVGNDVSALIAYRVEDCCGACSAYNYQQTHQGLSSKCTAFSFNANMSFAFANSSPPGGNNCFLKSQAGTGTPQSGDGRLYVGATLYQNGTK